MGQCCKKYVNIFLAAVLTLITLITLYRIDGFAPFGTKSLAWMDANIQYFDFYQYFQDVLKGQSSIAYTFGKTLGGTNVAVYSYYLASPFCLLLYFVQPADLHTYFDFVVAAKLALASGFMALFLDIRLEHSIQTWTDRVIIALLAIGYGLSQNSIAQASNLMWLDGVYMLPLLMLAIHSLVRNKCCWKLSLVVGLSIIFNWYTAGMNCVFSFFWLLFELAAYRQDVKERGESVPVFAILIRYGIAMLVGVLLSSILFLPTIGALKNSNRGQLDWNLLKNIRFHGKVSSMVLNYFHGAVSSNGTIALFCGSFTFLGAVGVFCTDRLARKERLYLGCLALFMALIIFWNPLYLTFSLFKLVESYWYRHAYFCIAILVYIAAHYFVGQPAFAGKDLLKPVIFGLILYLILIQDYLKGTRTGALKFAGALLIVTLLYTFLQKQKGILKGLCVLLLVSVVMADLGFNAHRLMKIYNTGDVASFRTYQQQERRQIAGIKAADTGMYRISQTATRNMGNNGVSAFWNEPLAYNYWGISGYTSSPDDVQRQFLNRLGYPISGPNMCIVNTSILGVDSLLGVKYILSRYPIPGLRQLNQLSMADRKAVYENPFALPMGVVINQVPTDAKGNPFEYQNQLYSQLLGKPVKLYEPLASKVKQTGNLKTKKPQVYEVQLKSGKQYVHYGNIPWDKEMDGLLTLNGKQKLAYSCWLSPSVFYMPVKQGQKKYTVTLSAKKTYSFKGEQQFYALHLDQLKKAADQLKQQVPDQMTIRNGHVDVTVNAAKSGQQLFLSIPYDKGWEITRNGQKVTHTLFGDCLYVIPLETGENHIVMTYHIPFLKIGIVCSVLGLLGIVAEYKVGRRRKLQAV